MPTYVKEDPLFEQKSLNPILPKGIRYVFSIDTDDHSFWLEFLTFFLSQPQEMDLKALQDAKVQTIIEQLGEQYLQCKPHDLKLFLSPTSAKVLLSLLQIYKGQFGQNDLFIRFKTDGYLDQLSQVKNDLNRWLLFSPV